MNHHPAFYSVLLALLLFNVPARAQAPGYTTPAAFMNLFFGFTGSNDPGYPAGRPTLGQMLTQSVIAEDKSAGLGPLVLVIGSDIYIYDAKTGARIAEAQFRDDPNSGFFEVTAISHIGPAIGYLAQIKANGDPRWKERLDLLRKDVAAVREVNARAKDNWLDQINLPAWNPHKAAIRNMVDYACATTLNYIDSLGDGSRFTVADVNDRFFSGATSEYPIPFDNVMIGTFMLDVLRTAFEVHEKLAPLKLDWPQAMVLVASKAGTNVSSGLTAGTNWLVLFMEALSGYTLPADRIKIVPYAEIRPSLGKPELAKDDLDYYVQRVWGPLFYRTLIADEVFASIPTIYLPGRPPLPGDYYVTKADDIDQFMIRLKHSLRDAREMLSNTVAFWMVPEMAHKNWDPAAVAIPGLTTGFPKSVTGYPR